MSPFERRLSAGLERLDQTRQLRQRIVVDPIDAARIRVDGQPLINFASNDYLGLSHHPKVIEAVRRGAAEAGFGSGGSGLIGGYTREHLDAERALAHWKSTESAILTASGYQANVAAIQTYAAVGDWDGGKGTRFLMDKLVHASLIDAVRTTGAAFRVFPHNDLGKLERLLTKATPGQLQVVVTESVFSMDGDVADLRGLSDLKRRFDFQLLVDEAHGGGVFGPDGTGFAAEIGLSDAVDVSIVTCSKAMGGLGGAVCCRRVFGEAMINVGRAYIYSTSVPAAQAAAVRAAIDVMRDEPWRQARVRAIARRVRMAIGDIRGHPDSPILPLIVGRASDALARARGLRAAGVFCLAVRPPTVPLNASRLRLTVTCAHTDPQIDLLITVLRP